MMRLQIGKLQTIPLERCTQIWRPSDHQPWPLNHTFGPQQICAAGLAPNQKGVWTNSCGGDSGGPLVWSDISSDTTYILGVVSWGQKPCGLGRDDPDGDGDTVPYPGVFARVSDLGALNWIHGCFKDVKSCGEPYTVPTIPPYTSPIPPFFETTNNL